MPITRWNPATAVSRGNIALGIAPSVADINAPTTTELNAALAIECSVTDFSASSSTDSESIDWICTPESEQLPASTSHEMDDLLIKATGQEDEDLITSLKIGDTIFIYRRDGKESAKEIAAGDYVWVWKVVITSIDPAEASNTFIGINAHVNVLARSKTAVKVVGKPASRPANGGNTGGES